MKFRLAGRAGWPQPAALPRPDSGFWRCVPRVDVQDGCMKTAHYYWMLFVVFAGMIWARAESLSPPQDADPEAYFEFKHRDTVDALYEEWLAQYADAPRMLVRRGLLADREEQYVEFLAEATGLPPSDPVEFVIIAETSGHDYEALAVSHAKPSAIHEALQFIGMEPGAPLNPPAFRFFPKGERVFITFSWTDEDGEVHERRAEELVMDDRARTSLPKDGFVFVGSQWIEEDGESVFAAESPHGPEAIVSTYNEPTTVFDVPRAEPQRDVYGWLRPHPERQAPYNQLLRIRVVPEFTDDQRRVADVTLDIRTGTEEAPVHVTLMDAEGEPLHDEPVLHQVLASLNRFAERDQIPFVTLQMHEDVALMELYDLTELLRRFEQKRMLHLEPPLAGDLFYRAFLPTEEHRDRAQRPSQALELRLARTNGVMSGRVVEIEDARLRREDPFEPEIAEYDVASPDALRTVLDEIAHPLPVLLVFVPADLTYGAVMDWMRPVMDTHPMIHLFLE